MVSAPIGVGGVGGSGTRVVAQMLLYLGFYLGPRLNVSGDTLDFPDFLNSVYLSGAPPEEKYRTACCLIQDFKKLILGGLERDAPSACGWGWKAPGSFFWIDYFSKYLKGIRFIQVIRHGGDMAFSSNLNQMRVMGPHLGIDVDALSKPRAAFQYWLKANELAVEKGTGYLGERFLLLNFDDLCSDPVYQIERLAGFLMIEPTKAQLEHLRAMIKAPNTRFRYLEKPFEDIIPAKEFFEIEKFGFQVTELDRERLAKTNAFSATPIER